MFSIKNKFRTSYGFTLILMLSLLFNSCTNSGLEPADLKKQVDNINRQCPKMVDSETQLKKVELKGANTIAYYYGLVNLSKLNVDTHQFNLNLWPGLLSGVKLDPELLDLREKECRFEYHYFDKSNHLIYTFKIGPELYKP